MTAGLHSINSNFLREIYTNKRYFVIDKQKARHFVHFSEILTSPILFYATQIINPFLNLRISANQDKERNFSQ